MSQKKFSTYERNSTIKLLSREFSLEDISQYHGRNLSDVRKLIINIVFELHKEGNSFESIQNITSLDLEEILLILDQKTKLKWSTYEEELLYMELGSSYEYLSEIHNRSIEDIGIKINSFINMFYKNGYNEDHISYIIRIPKDMVHLIIEYMGDNDNENFSENNIDARWIEYEEEKLLDEIYKGISIKEISKIHRRTEKEIEEKLEEIIINMKLNHTYEEINYMLNIPEKKIKDIVHNRNRYINEDTSWIITEDSFLLDEFKSGYSIKEISKIHRRTEESIKDRLKKFNIS